MSNMDKHYETDEIDYNNREQVLAAVKESGWQIEYASKKLKNDKELVLEAMKTAGGAILFVSKKLQKDKEVIMQAAKNDPNILRFFDFNGFKFSDL